MTRKISFIQQASPTTTSDTARIEEQEDGGARAVMLPGRNDRTKNRVKRMIGFFSGIPILIAKIGTTIAASGGTVAAAATSTAVSIPAKIGVLAATAGSIASMPVTAVASAAGAVTGIALGVELGVAPVVEHDARIAEAEAAARAAVEMDREMNIQREQEQAQFDLSIFPDRRES